MNRRRRILVIDDNHAIHGDFQKILASPDLAATRLDAEAAELFGGDTAKGWHIPFEVDSAYQGEQGVEMVRQAREAGHPYAMAIVDMRMPPGWDGVETTVRIWELDPEVQVVICTAYADSSWKEMLKSIGAGDRMIVLKKPFEPIEAFQMANMLTEKWWLQQQARSKLETLELKVTERTRELRDSNRELRRKSEEIQYFYHTLSHELKTPLTSVSEFIAIVAEGLAGELNPSQAEYLEIARQNCSYLATYINDLLDASRLETGKMSLHLKPESPVGLIRQVITTMQPEATRKNIILREEFGADQAEVVIDKCRIVQVLTNLYNNALKFTPEGGTVVARIRRDRQRPECFEISVTDTGCGIAEQQIGLLFQRYYQTDQPNSGNPQGVGLGLYLCREL
ncbi:MAG TPA: ATP-binding protein, partial [Xanthomonadales bacterium]|nr:ATP-binding protein [Xanthomonadales bacterium]